MEILWKKKDDYSFQWFVRDRVIWASHNTLLRICGKKKEGVKKGTGNTHYLAHLNCMVWKVYALAAQYYSTNNENETDIVITINVSTGTKEYIHMLWEATSKRLSINISTVPCNVNIIICIYMDEKGLLNDMTWKNPADQRTFRVR